MPVRGDTAGRTLARDCEMNYSGGPQTEGPEGIYERREAMREVSCLNKKLITHKYLHLNLIFSKFSIPQEF
jgi:hypothetical protein